MAKYRLKFNMSDGSQIDAGEIVIPKPEKGIDYFTEADKAELIAEILDYKAIAISSFAATPSTAEMGSTVNSVALSWAVNKTPTTLTLDGATIDTTETKKTLTGTFTSNKTWTLKATDERGATATKTATLSFLNGVYYGAAAKPSAKVSIQNSRAFWTT